MNHPIVGSAQEPASLPPCRNPLNCVTDSPENSEPALRPIAFHTSAEDAMIVIRDAVAQIPRTRVVVNGRRYLRAESRSLVFRFVDDVELLVDRDAGLIHFRSASRVGRRDFDVNRRRLLRLTAFIRDRLGLVPTP